MRQYMHIVETAYLGELMGAEAVHRAGKQTFSSMNEFIQFMSQRGFTCLGHGAYGAVFDCPEFNGKYVMKVFHDPIYLHHVKYCMAHIGNPHLPRFFGRLMKITDKAAMVRVEVLQPVQREVFRHKIFPAISYLNGFRTREAALEKVGPGLIETLEDIAKHSPSGAKLDFHGGNFMMRGDTVVVTDPYASSTPNADLPFPESDS